MEAYRAEMYKTAGKNSDWTTAEGQFNFDEFGKDGDVLSVGFTWDACFLLTGNMADVYVADEKCCDNVRLYKQGEFGFCNISPGKEAASIPHADISMYDDNTNACDILEVSRVASDYKSLNEMLDKYKVQEDKYALTFGVRVAKDGPDGKTKAGGGHCMNILKITNDTVYISNTWQPNKTEPIPKDVFLQMVTKFVAVPV